MPSSVAAHETGTAVRLAACAAGLRTRDETRENKSGLIHARLILAGLVPRAPPSAASRTAPRTAGKSRFFLNSLVSLLS
jgi:hypothetical protein